MAEAGNEPDAWGLVEQEIEPINLKEIEIDWNCREVVCEFDGGWRIEKLPFEDYMTEGIMMGHCLGVLRNVYKDHHCFSLRDEHGQPHVTIVCFPTKKPKVIYEIRGRWNMGPRPDFRVMIQAWLDRDGIEGDDIHMPYNRIDDDTEYHEQGIIRTVVTGVEGVYTGGLS